MSTYKNINRIFCFALVIFAFGFGGCVNDLDTTPIDPNISDKDNTYKDLYDYEQGLAKLYAGFAVSGQQGPAGNPDLGGLDEGASQYLRKYWEFQELPTDEALNGWADPGQPALSEITWNPSNELVRILYYRVTFQVTLCNQFIRDLSEASLSSEEDMARIRQMKAEARFVRALAYWHGLDLFGNGIPFTTEETLVGSTPPSPPASGFGGTEIFDYIESELMDITSNDSDEQLKAENTAFVGQADKAAAHMLLSKLYLNAEVYIGQSKWAEAKTSLDKVVAAGYRLEDRYEYNFLADNYLSREIIFPIAFDGVNTQTYGGMTYLINAAVGGDMSAKEYGTSGGWGGNRSTIELVKKFEDQFENQVDPRGIFFKEHNRENTTLPEFKDGYAVGKYKNVTSLGYPGSDPNLSFMDTNFPMFRLADAYLMLAEVEFRMGGSISDWSRIESLWDRAGVPQNIQSQYKAAASVDPAQFLLDERARELYWEGHRRTDLVRFGKFVKDYNWPFKGGSPTGNASIAERYNVLPIPGTELVANPNLKQNPMW
ncbi:RagB/SusD family nutrient uptake outer membrane protein [Aureibacter tunicatorum]|uniref:RagB/SusD domain-containing protein n=1 Tax=Aureibacter tunicatorum TaxID=866807 RepID=A0AAE4BSR6_9BACT|nr:RagB/SusD family nutrient uptake outer membrane protein [Aureibacter tunicatorum]MDR6238707.1 hypothetical protein [Aureibacter tunicatorum]BDD05362.1 outer membrane protein [Aureibacter tunicatorum]